jgi:hypothetical protein
MQPNLTPEELAAIERDLAEIVANADTWEEPTDEIIAALDVKGGAGTLPVTDDKKAKCPRRTDKKAKSQRRKSALRDGDFVQALWAYLRSGDALAWLDSLVGESSPLPISLPQSLQPRPRNIPWGSIGDETKALFYHLALRRMGNRYGFTLRLTPAVEAKARAQGPQCLDWLHQRVGNHLRLALNHSPKFWFCNEQDGSGRLHLHGELVVPADDVEQARAGLKKAGGRWRGSSSQFQLRLQAAPDLRYVGYAVKHVRRASPGWRQMMQRYGNPRHWSVSFQGRALSATNGVTRGARELYEEIAPLVKDYAHKQISQR